MLSEMNAVHSAPVLTDREQIKAGIRESVRRAREFAREEQSLIIRLQTASSAERQTLVHEIQSIQLAWERQ